MYPLLKFQKCRVTCALLSGFIFPALTYIALEFSEIIWIAFALDILAFIDIYIRLHVCYYNDQGILVSHPLSTAKHYLAHGFAVDLLGALPLYMIQQQSIVNTAGEIQISSFGREIARMNKVIQLYR